MACNLTTDSTVRKFFANLSAFEIRPGAESFTADPEFGMFSEVLEGATDGRVEGIVLRTTSKSAFSKHFPFSKKSPAKRV